MLSRLALDLSSGDRHVEGLVRIYGLRPPCLACLGAMRQLRRQWPKLAIQAPGL